MNGTGAKKVNLELSNAVREAIEKIGDDDLESVRAEVVLGRKIEASRGELKEAIAGLSRTVKRKKLSNLQMYKLMSWIDAQREYIPKSGKTSEVLAHEVGAKIGCEVTSAVFRHQCKQLGVKLPITKSSNNNQKGYNQHTTAWIIRRLEAIEKALGMEPPPYGENGATDDAAANRG